MSCPKLSIPGIPEFTADERERNIPPQYVRGQRMDTVRDYPQYRQHPLYRHHPPGPQQPQQTQYLPHRAYRDPDFVDPGYDGPNYRDPDYLDHELEEEVDNLYDEQLTEERRYHAAYVQPIEKAHIHESKISMSDLARIHALEQDRLREEIARMRAVRNYHELSWKEAPVDRYMQQPGLPPMYGPPARFPGENDDQGIRLVPQPTISPEDPLNWSWWEKHAVLAALIPGCLLSDWTLTWGTTVFELQAPEWNMTVPAVAQSVSPGIFMQGPGGLLAVPLCERYGRLPVLFWSQLLSLIVTVGATVAPGYASFTAMRTLQGFFGAAPQVIGLSIIHDMFFYHERTRKINIWAASFLIGPYLGPFFSSLLLLKLDWRPDFGVLAGFYGFSVLMVAIFGDETLFDRADIDKLPAGHRQPFQKRRPFSLRRHLTRLLVGIPAWRRCPNTPSLWSVFRNQCSLLTRPYLLVPTALFVTPVTMWTIGMVSTISMFVLPPPPVGYGFSYVALSMLYFAPMIGTLLAEGWGHWFNDVLARRFAEPEGRLTAVYPAAIIGAAGLVLFGQVLENHLSWAGLAFGWAMLCFCTLACMTAISAYLLDCFPKHAALASAWINCWRVVGGFAVVYFQMEWVHGSGPGTAFGYQAVIIAATTITVFATQVWGRCWRKKFPPPQAADGEEE